MNRFAVIIPAWGERYVREAEACVLKSEPLRAYDLFLITDPDSAVSRPELFKEVIRADFQLISLQRKTEISRYLPESYDAWLILDGDTVVLDDISFGFEMALKYGVAIVPAPLYDLDTFHGFEGVLEASHAGFKSRLQYNTGVIFLANRPRMFDLLSKWKELITDKELWNDQPFFTLAMELLEINPYALSPAYNCRGLGEVICGKVRIWHSRMPVPPNLNRDTRGWARRMHQGHLIRMGEENSMHYVIRRGKSKIRKSFRWLFKRKPDAIPGHSGTGRR